MSVLPINRKQEAFWWMNILISLLLGTVLYCILNSGFFLTNVVRGLFGPHKKLIFGHALVSKKLFTAVCLYGRDFLWAYALVFAIAYWMKGSLKGLRQAFSIVAGFEILLELWKLSSFMSGTFDLKNLAAVAAGNILAILLILIRERAIV